MRLALYLLLGHLIGDFVFQTADIVELKRSRTFGLYVHVALVSIATVAVTAGPEPEVLLAVAIVLMSHIALDRLSITIRNADKASSVSVFLMDQIFHVAVIAAVSAFFSRLAGPAAPSFLLPVEERSLAVLVGATGTAFAGTVLAFELGASLFGPDDAAREIMDSPVRRAFGVAERGVLFLSLTVGPLGLTGVVLVRPAYLLAARTAPVRWHVIEYAIGLVAVVTTASLFRWYFGT